MTNVDNKIIAKRMLDLQAMFNQFSAIKRMIYLPDDESLGRKDQRENDVEHSYHLAMHAWYLCSVFPELDQSKVIRYALAHDLVEIQAGDVMAIGRTQHEQADKDAREAAALKQLQSDWPDFADMTNTIVDYEKQSDPEAIFVKALDKTMPILHQIASDGKTWKKYDLDRKTVIENKNVKTAPSPEITAIWQEFKDQIMNHPEWFNEGKAT